MNDTFRGGPGDTGPGQGDGGRRRRAPSSAGHRRKPSAGPRVLGAIAGTAALAVIAGGGYTLFGPDRSGSARAGAGTAAAALDLAPAGTDTTAGLSTQGGPATTGPTASPSPAATPSTAAPTATPSTAAPATTAAAKPAAKAADAAAPTAARQPAAKPAAAGQGTPSGRTADFVSQVTDLVNAERAKAGCGPLTLNTKLNAAAQQHSDDMVARHYFEHADPEGHHADSRIEAAGYHWSSWGENIAYGQADPAAVMDDWMHSPAHRENILNCDFKEIGIGVNFGAGGPWWTQVFAAPR
ncbi:CAP domain-containing protein [Kitasatospora sp. MBT63]|uniref:CAP domain-containing protein n=1 Tax=Kitasatospora sp. MBT63 TaxID=1444768 RepID=UPI00068E0D7A|nr:CAP domain-containing protein [Kitasatospora sp. MBT63]